MSDYYVTKWRDTYWVRRHSDGAWVFGSVDLSSAQYQLAILRHDNERV